MFRVLFVLVGGLAFAAPVFAASIQVLQPLQLQKAESGGYGRDVFVELENPGQESDQILSPGCQLSIESSVNRLPAGHYAVTMDEVTRPSMWDKRWWRNVESSKNQLWIHLSCKAHRSISTSLINRTMVGLIKLR